MSRIGFKSIKVTDNIILSINDDFVHVIGPKGNLMQILILLVLLMN